MLIAFSLIIQNDNWKFKKSNYYNRTIIRTIEWMGPSRVPTRRSRGAWDLWDLWFFEGLFEKTVNVLCYNYSLRFCSLSHKKVHNLKAIQRTYKLRSLLIIYLIKHIYTDKNKPELILSSHVFYPHFHSHNFFNFISYKLLSEPICLNHSLEYYR